MIKATCPKCGNGGQFEDRFAGLNARCARCQTRFVIPVSPTVEEPPPLPQEVALSVEDEEPPPLPKQDGRSAPVEEPPPIPVQQVPPPAKTVSNAAASAKKNRLVLWIAGGGAALLVIVVVLGFRSDSTSVKNAGVQPSGVARPTTSEQWKQLAEQNESLAREASLIAIEQYLTNSASMGPARAAIFLRTEHPAQFANVQKIFQNPTTGVWTFPSVNSKWMPGKSFDTAGPEARTTAYGIDSPPASTPAAAPAPTPVAAPAPYQQRFREEEALAQGRLNIAVERYLSNSRSMGPAQAAVLERAENPATWEKLRSTFLNKATGQWTYPTAESNWKLGDPYDPAGKGAATKAAGVISRPPAGSAK